MATKTKPRVTGLGGVFFKANNCEMLSAWYRDRLGLPVEEWGGCSFHWLDAKDPTQEGHTVWSVFDAKTPYFKPSRKSFMMNYRVDDLDRVLAELRDEGVKVMDATEDSEYGKFGWVVDPEGNKVELWQPPTPVSRIEPEASKPAKSKKAKKAKKEKKKAGRKSKSAKAEKRKGKSSKKK